MKKGIIHSHVINNRVYVSLDEVIVLLMEDHGLVKNNETNEYILASAKAWIEYNEKIKAKAYFSNINNQY